MAYSYVDAASLQPRWGTFRFIRAELGGTAFGLNQIDFMPGRYILVSPDATRRPTAGPDGMSFICVGGVPGGVFEPWIPPDE